MYGVNEIRSELFNYLATISDVEASLKRNEDEWSILEILEHLYLIERYMTLEIQKILEGSEKKKAMRQKPLESTLDRSKRYKSPELFEPKKVPKNLDKAIQRLTSSRQSLSSILSIYHPTEFTSASGKHLAFGTMNVEQWIKFIGLHEKRHLEQIKEIREG